jgi:hypothetical protein
VVLETLAPAERLAFVLHDMFGVAFNEVAPIVGRSPDAARKLASRARPRVQRASAVPDADLIRQREVVDAFLAASRGGDFDALLPVLDPEVVLRADRAAVSMGASREVRGAPAVADTFSGRARGARPALVNGAVGLVWARRGRPHVVFGFTITRGKIVEIDLVAEPSALASSTWWSSTTDEPPTPLVGGENAGSSLVLCGWLPMRRRRAPGAASAFIAPSSTAGVSSGATKGRDLAPARE